MVRVYARFPCDDFPGRWEVPDRKHLSPLPLPLPFRPALPLTISQTSIEPILLLFLSAPFYRLEQKIFPITKANIHQRRRLAIFMSVSRN